MPKLFCIINAPGGSPNIPPEIGYKGYVLAGDLPGSWGAYLFSGTAAQLTAINALPNVYGIVAVTEAGGVIWPELNNVISAAVRTRINDWLNARGYPSIPPGWTYKQVIIAVFKRINPNYEIGNTNILE